MKAHSKPKSKGEGKMEIRFEESDSHLATDIDKDELYDDDVSDDGEYFTDRTCAWSEGNMELMVSYGTDAYGTSVSEIGMQWFGFI